MLYFEDGDSCTRAVEAYECQTGLTGYFRNFSIITAD